MSLAISVGRESSFIYLVKLFLPASAAATGGGWGGTDSSGKTDMSPKEELEEKELLKCWILKSFK